MKASKLLRNWCIGYLASVVDVLIEQKVKPEDVHVVNEFVDLFPEDLPGIPPDRCILYTNILYKYFRCINAA